MRWLKWLEREFTDRKVRGANPTSASRLPLSKLGQPGSIPALLLPSCGMAARHRKGVTAEQFYLLPFLGTPAVMLCNKTECQQLEKSKFHPELEEASQKLHSSVMESYHKCQFVSALSRPQRCQTTLLFGQLNNTHLKPEMNQKVTTSNMGPVIATLLVLSVKCLININTKETTNKVVDNPLSSVLYYSIVRPLEYRTS
ncbi:hypothetical protein CSKR_106669 [Clonorchis sinensis]|uniref:Uncharacterized protein n=1 Tax=Clonorchis sinensis TaxID=79923 RepID=A0A3R7EY98_CLOSI|nr:hypothetical protein CSKR_106669 [Clonorchis sinensis]